MYPDCKTTRNGPYSDWHSCFWSLLHQLYCTLFLPTNICREGTSAIKSVQETTKPRAKTKFLPASSLTYRNIPQNALSLLDNSLNIHHFGMWEVDWLSWRSWFYSGTKFAPRSWIFFKNFEVKLAAGASKFRPKTDKAIGVQATYKHTVVHNEPAKYHKF